MRLDDKGFGLGLLALIITIFVIGIVYSMTMMAYIGKSTRQQDLVGNTFAGENVSAPSVADDPHEGVLPSIKASLNVSLQKELDRARALGAE